MWMEFRLDQSEKQPKVAVSCRRPGPRRPAAARCSARLCGRRSACAGANLLLAGILAGRRLAGGERRGRGAAFLEVLVLLRFLLFLVAAHLTLGHDELSLLRPVETMGATARITNRQRFGSGGVFPKPPTHRFIPLQSEYVCPGRSAARRLFAAWCAAEPGP